MGRPREFIEADALTSAIALFREHGFEGTSARALVEGMGIGRQSLYDAFGDKWRLYLAAVRQYVMDEAGEHLRVLRSSERAVDGLRSFLTRVADDASPTCLGVNSICEFGRREAALLEIHQAATRTIAEAVGGKIKEAQAAGDVSASLDPAGATAFLMSTLAGLRVAKRGGADKHQLAAIAALAMRALT